MCAKKLLILAVLFAVLASPMTYSITRDVFGSWVASPSGCASQGGVLLHAAVFAGALYAMWKISKREKYTPYRMPPRMPNKYSMPPQMPSRMPKYSMPPRMPKY